MILKDGRIVTFEVSIEQFNQLRYMVAKVRQHVFITLTYYQCSSSVSKYDINIDESLTTTYIIANDVIFDHILSIGTAGDADSRATPHHEDHQRVQEEGGGGVQQVERRRRVVAIDDDDDDDDDVMRCL